MISQDYLEKHQDEFKGLILTGSGLLNSKRKILDDGTSEFSIKTPSLTIGATKDGLFRITRGAVSYWHQIKNINEEQKGLHQYVALEGLSHSSFMDSSMLPSAVVKSDLKPEVEEKTAHNQIANSVVNFMSGKTQEASLANSTAEFMKPLLAGMELEGSYEMKDPCYNKGLINDYSPKCLHGSQWTPVAQSIMGGNLPGA